jgi:hypothetical protein
VFRHTLNTGLRGLAFPLGVLIGIHHLVCLIWQLRPDEQSEWEGEGRGGWRCGLGFKFSFWGGGACRDAKDEEAPAGIVGTREIASLKNYIERQASSIRTAEYDGKPLPHRPLNVADSDADKGADKAGQQPAH